MTEHNVRYLHQPSSFFRSADMSLCELFVETDAAFECVAELGETGLVQFRDLNEGASARKRRFIGELKRCDEMSRKLCFIENEIEIDDMKVRETSDKIYTPQPREIKVIEARINRIYDELASITDTLKALKDSNLHLWELSQVIEKVELMVDTGDDHDSPESSFVVVETSDIDDDSIRLIDEEAGREREGTDLRRVTGIIPRSRVFAFERLLWRMCNGSIFMRAHDCDAGLGLFNEQEAMSVFVLFFSGGQLAQKVDHVCRGSPARLYKCPEDLLERHALYQRTKDRLNGLNEVIDRTLDHKKRVLTTAARSVFEWKIKVRKATLVFRTLDVDFRSVDDATQRSLAAECWIPTADLEEVRAALIAGAIVSGSLLQPILNVIEPVNEERPTHFTLNKFTRGFQALVSAYGIADYKELNPAPWIIISFPFLFAVMFGDIGHAVIMLLLALFLVVFERRLTTMRIKDEIFCTFFGGRYIILLMGAFSLYTGFVYNDCFGRSINIFGSAWATGARNNSCWNSDELKDLDKREQLAAERNRTFDVTLDPAHCFDAQAGFPFMIDPVWDLAHNRLNYLNSLKMKAAIFLGILQMTFGLFLSLGNHLHRNSLVDVLFTFAPQLLFLCCIFVYLCAQIIVKWIVFPAGPSWIFGRFYPGSNCAPSLLIGLINMFLLTNRTDGFGEFKNSTNFYINDNADLFSDEFESYPHCSSAYWYPGQWWVERTLLAVAAISIPLMLLGKPLYIKWKRSNGYGSLISQEHSGGVEEFSIGNSLIYQAIHTIEFVLGCVSHTASYLRLWALSLAHGVLAEVLWSMLLNKSLQIEGWLGAPVQFVIVFIFGILTVTILVLMESLSAFLHALRLHWVEFQSKFYSGNGVAFEPFSFEKEIQRVD